MTGAAITAAGSQAAILRGRIFVLLSGAGMSLGGLFIRSIEQADEWQILFWRSLAIVSALLIFMSARSRGRLGGLFRAAGTRAALAGLCLAIGFACFVFSMTHTTVANTLFMLSAGPFIAALLGWFLLGESVHRATWIAMAGAVCGVAVMVAEGLVMGDLFGNLMGLAAAIAFAGFSVALRSGHMVDMMPAICFAGLFSAAAAAGIIFLAGTGFAAPAGDIGLCVAYGALAIGGSLILYTLGSRQVPAAELTLLSLTEVVLGPVWVWLVFAETPSPMTLGGGAILLTAIAGRAMAGIGRRRPPIGTV